MTTPLSYFDLLEAFPKPGCAVCALVQHDVEHYLDSLLYERVTSPETHHQFRAGRGQCNEHAWMLTRYGGGSLGVAILYRGLINDLITALESAPPGGGGRSGKGLFGGGGGSPLADRLEPTGTCMACALQADSEEKYVQTFSDYLGDDRLQTAYLASAGVCLPHFRQALRQTGDVNRRHKLIEFQVAIWSRLRADLDEFQAKSDYRRSSEDMGPEGDSWLRAISSMAGGKGIFGKGKT